MDDRVGVEDKNVFALAGLNSNVVSLSKPKVQSIFDQTNLGEFRPDELDGSVGGSVVRNDYLKVDNVSARINRL